MPRLSGPRASEPAGLIVPAWVAAEIVGAARRAAPLEACGVLVGRAGGAATEVRRQRLGRNVHDRPVDRFQLAPEDLLAAEREARRDGLEVVGIWHSHPSSAAVPSEVDRGAAWDGYSYLIVSVAGEAPELRSWRLAGEELEEQEVTEPLPVEGMRP